MNWKVRHAGSPRAVDGLTLAQVLDGLEQARWDPTDEVMGPDDVNWTPIEQHPQLEEAAAALEPPPQPNEDEARLDFNPLIDVALVLLIFFILTTSYAALQKVLDMPSSSAKKADGKLRVVPEAKIKEITPVDRVRTRRRAFERMVDCARERHANGADTWIVQHIHDPDSARRLVDECRQVFGTDPALVSEIGPVIGAHAGPGLLGFGAATLGTDRI